jgi:predicted polyphosphate/ATP-dependent NAD kinase
LKAGLLINPLAGVGGAVGLKGSDGDVIAAEALRRGAVPRAEERAAAMLQSLGADVHRFEWLCAGGVMGGRLLRKLGVAHIVVASIGEPSTAEDTRMTVQALMRERIDVLVFAGGDGTARDILLTAGTSVPVIGIPAGVKMHSGVFATSPRSAGLLLRSLLHGELVYGVTAEVRDVDETAAREGWATSRCFGELAVPVQGGFLQHTKIGGREDEGLAVEEIVQGVCARISDETGRPLVLGPGGTLLSIKERLIDQSGKTDKGTLLGVDVRMPDGSWFCDVMASDLLSLPGQPLLIVGLPRQQGILFGRGNQQLSAAFLRRLHRRRDIVVVATRAKIKALEGRPLLLDTGDAGLDQSLAGLWEILCGYDDRLLYRVEAG